MARPPAEHQQLADFLLRNHVRYISTDYWTGYTIAFLTLERVRPLTDFERVAEYTTTVRAQEHAAVEIRRIRQAPCLGGIEIADWRVCAPPGWTLKR